MRRCLIVWLAKITESRSQRLFGTGHLVNIEFVQGRELGTMVNTIYLPISFEKGWAAFLDFAKEEIDNPG